MCFYSGVSRRVRRMIQTRLPDMSGFNDVGDYLLNNGDLIVLDALSHLFKRAVFYQN